MKKFYSILFSYFFTRNRFVSACTCYSAAPCTFQPTTYVSRNFSLLRTFTRSYLCLEFPIHFYKINFHLFIYNY